MPFARFSGCEVDDSLADVEYTTEHLSGDITTLGQSRLLKVYAELESNRFCCVYQNPRPHARPGK